MKRGFTLIEILVVVSIISMLSSVVAASVTPARAKARDSVRTQQVRQVDLAIQLYKANHNGKAPDLQTGCSVQQSLNAETVSGCIAISTQGESQNGQITPWKKLKNDLQPYIASLPNDPCGSSCTSNSGYPLGYTYVSPAAMQYYCTLYNNCTASDESYQLYSALEHSSGISGSGNNSSGTYYPPPSDTTPPSVPTNFATALNGLPGSQTVTSTWNISTDTGGSGVAGYTIYGRRQDTYIYSGDTTQTTIITGGSANLPWGTTVCFWVEAFDVAGNRSQSTAESCQNIATPGPNEIVSPPTNLQATVTSLGGGRYQVNFNWNPSTSLADPGIINSYGVYRNSNNVSYVPSTNYSSSFGWVIPFCWSVNAEDWAGNISQMSQEYCVTAPIP